MSEAAKDSKDEIVASPEGSVKTTHGLLKMADYPTKYKAASGATLEGAEIIFENVGKGTVDTFHVPGKSFLELPHRGGEKQAVVQLTQADKGTKFTIVQTMGNKGFWNLDKITVGSHEGRAGNVKPSAGGDSSNSSGSFDSGAAAAGQLINIALALASAGGATFTFEDVIVKATQMAQEYSTGKDRVKAALAGVKKASAPTVAATAPVVDLVMDNAKFETPKVTSAAI